MLDGGPGMRPRLPADFTSSLAILAGRFGSMTEAQNYASGSTLPSGLAPERLAGIQHVTADPSAAMANVGRLDGSMATRLLGAAKSEGPLSTANVFAVANAVMQGFQGAAERRQIDAAFAKLHLDSHNPRQVLAAYAYVWAHNFGPWAVSGVPFEGDAGGINERFARALSRYELSHPGTVFLATRGHVPSQSVIQYVADAAIGGHTVADPPITVSERSSDVDAKLSASSRVARTVLGIQSNGHWQAHHVIPFAEIAALSRTVQLAIVRSGWSMNSADNVIALPADEPTYYGPPNATVLPWHNTNHPRYSADVRAALVPIAATATAVPPAILHDQLRGVDLRFKVLLVRNRRDYHPRLR